VLAVDANDKQVKYRDSQDDVDHRYSATCRHLTVLDAPVARGPIHQTADWKSGDGGYVPL